MTGDPVTAEPVTSGPPPAQGELLPTSTADAEALREIYGRGVEEAASPGGVGAYVRDVTFRVLNRFAEWLDERMAFFDWLEADLVFWGLRVLFVLLALFLLGAAARWLWRRRPAPKVGDGAVEPETPRDTHEAPADRAAQLRRRLTSGDVAGALEALWWWLAEALGTPRADPAWTSRELLLHAGRRDLRGELRHFDRLAYGPSEPTAGEVRTLWRRLAEQVGGQPDDPEAVRPETP